ncbi:unnamed protein product [Miscanthus lutarioriparius]|uniref:Fe2OG dioxygenase domain-containing protein n=1 Tax=Miscanthus lutarioriparius TaxID=422564 RepID=A0A811R3C9_9POAL|nr:unnamed protein product [Miscanthus lutarioriparius]
MAGASACHSPDPCTDDGEHAVPDAGTTGIPVVDLDALVNGAAEQRAQAVRDVGRACQDWGFFMHDMEGGQPRGAGGSQRSVYGGVRGAVQLTGGGEGGVPGGRADGARARRLRLLRGRRRRPVLAGLLQDVRAIAHPELHCPATPAKLREVATEYAATTRRLLLSLSTAVSEAMRLESCFQILVANRYPPYTAGPGLGLPEHSDHGFLTLLFQNGVDGLQVHHGGRWLLATPLPGAFFVIAGDQLEIVSNGRYKGVLHRAVVGGERARMSMVSMISPCLDTVVKPVPELAADG